MLLGEEHLRRGLVGADRGVEQAVDVFLRDVFHVVPARLHLRTEDACDGSPVAVFLFVQRQVTPLELHGATCVAAVRDAVEDQLVQVIPLLENRRLLAAVAADVPGAQFLLDALPAEDVSAAHGLRREADDLQADGTAFSQQSFQYLVCL